MSKVKTEASQKASLKSNQKAVSKENVEMAIKSKSKQTAKKVSSNIAMAKPPLAVRKLLTELFPEVKPKEIEWGWEIPHKIYEAEFMLDGISHEVEITVTGHHLLTEQNIPVDLVPAKLLGEIKKSYKQFEIDSAEMVTLGNGKMHYEIDLKSKKDDEISKTLLVWPNGVIREESDDKMY
jgi:hypothetical protein